MGKIAALIWTALTALMLVTGDARAQFNGCAPGFCNTVSSSIPFPGDLAAFDIAQGMLYPPTQAACTASRTTPQPAFEVYAVPASGILPGSTITINYTNCILDLAAIATAQDSTGAFPANMLVKNQLLVTRRFDFSGNGNDGVQLTQANMPILTVIDGEPHLICGTDDSGNPRFLSYPVTPNLTNQFLAITHQNYGANDITTGNGGPFFTSSASSIFGIGLLAHTITNDASATVAQSTEWRYYNPSGVTGFQNGVPTGIKQSNNNIPIVMSSGASNLRFVFGDEVFSPGSNPFAPYAPANGVALIIGNSNLALGSLGYYDNVYFKNAAQSSTFDDNFAATLRQLLPTYDAGINIVFDGASLPSGLHAYAAYIAGNAQGSASYGLQQAMQKRVSARWTNLAIQGSLTAAIQARFPYARGLYKLGKKNIYLVNWDMLNSTDAASLASTFHGAATGQSWTFVVMGTGDRVGTKVAINAAVAAAANVTPIPGSGYSFIPGLLPATWSAALLAGYTTQQLNAYDGSHLSGVGVDIWVSNDSASPFNALIAAIP